MKNKILLKTMSAMLAVVMVLCSAPLSGSFAIKAEAEELTEGFYTYEVSDGEAIITACDQSSISGDVVIPSTLGGYPVTGISDKIFGGDEDIETATIPESITDMVPGVFYVCKNLREIIVDADNQYYCNDESGVLYNKDKTELLQYPIGNSDEDFVIPDSVTTVGAHAFSHAVNLTSVTFGKNVESMVGYAFHNCKNLKTVTMNDGLKTPGQCTFGRCTSLESVVIPDSVTAIEDSMFVGCESLESVTIGNGVSSIGFDAFYECNKLSDVYYRGREEDWNKITIGIENECLTNATIHFVKTSTPAEDFKYKITNGEVTITGYTGADADVIIPAEIEGYPVTSIGSSAFDNCTSLTSVTIPDSVISIDNRAFRDCTSLTLVTIGDSVTSIGNNAFRDCTSLTLVTIGDSVTSIGNYAFYDCDSLTSVTIGNSVTSIGSSAFENCTSLASITIGDSVTSIGNDAFRDCTSLARVYYTGDIESWCGIEFGGIYASPMYYAKNFYINNTLVKEIVIPDTVTEIKDDAFCGFEGVTSVTIGNSVTSIGYYAFYDCTSLETVTIPGSVLNIGDYAFYGCTSLASVTIPDSVTSIDGYAFENCTSLARVYYTGNIESWCGINFNGIYANPMYYAKNFYINNTLVKEFVIPDTVTKIKDLAFCGFEGVTSVTIPDSVTSVGEYAFNNCTSLTSVTIGDSVTSIGSHAFNNCTSLTDVYYTGDIESWCGIEFGGIYANPKRYADNIYFDGKVVEDVIIPEGATAIKMEAFYNFDSVKTVTIPASVITIHENAFYNCWKIEKVIFEGTESQWEEIAIYNGNDYLKNAEVTFLNGGHEHHYESTVVAPTCTETGLETFTCRCGDTYTEVLPATGHTWSKWMVAVEPTETDNGFKARFCTVCDDAIESEVIPATGSGEKPESGITITLTDENGNVIIKEIVSDYNTDISFENGTYTLTISKENYVARTYTVTAADNMMSLDFSLNRIGDMNGDGKVNTVDVAKANAHAKGVSTLSGYNLACVDVNGDGKVNTVDVAKMNAHAKGVTTLW